MKMNPVITILAMVGAGVSVDKHQYGFAIYFGLLAVWFMTLHLGDLILRTKR